MSVKRKSNVHKSSVKKGHWSMGLKASMEDPELKIEEDDRIVIIKDKYPKAKHHYLVLPKENIPNLKQLNKSHLPLLQHMEKKGKELIERLEVKIPYRSGYHAVPSMSQIHLHVISQDFDSLCLKTKKHWNSFTTAYFIDSTDLLKQLEESGSIKTMDSQESKSLLNTALRCHACKTDCSNMPNLKQHLKSCKKIIS